MSLTGRDDRETAIQRMRWTIYVCDEPDGQDCDSGTHPNILSHRCQALRSWHAWHAAADRGEVKRDAADAPRGPRMRMVKVGLVETQAGGDSQ